MAGPFGFIMGQGDDAHRWRPDVTATDTPNQLVAQPERAANDNARSPEQQATVDEVLARRRRNAAAVAPTAEFIKVSSRLAKRQRVGGDGPVAANDNQGWPLAEQLRREGNEVLLFVAERYRRTYDAAHTEAPLIGTVIDDTYSVDQRVHNREDGSVGYKGTRRVKGAIGLADGDDGTYKVVAIDEDVRAEIESGVATFHRKPAKQITKKWAGDNIIIAAIDAKKTIWRLQAALGPLLEVFEDAVLHGETLSSIGERKGVTPQKSGAAGRVLVMMGLEVVQREFHQIDRDVA